MKKLFLITLMFIPVSVFAFSFTPDPVTSADPTMSWTTAGTHMIAGWN